MLVSPSVGNHACSPRIITLPISHRRASLIILFGNHQCAPRPRPQQQPKTPRNSATQPTYTSCERLYPLLPKATLRLASCRAAVVLQAGVWLSATAARTGYSCLFGPLSLTNGASRIRRTLDPEDRSTSEDAPSGRHSFTLPSSVASYIDYDVRTSLTSLNFSAISAMIERQSLELQVTRPMRSRSTLEPRNWRGTPRHSRGWSMHAGMPTASLNNPPILAIDDRCLDSTSVLLFSAVSRLIPSEDEAAVAQTMSLSPF